MVLGMIAIACGAVHAAEINVGTETHETSGAMAPACTVSSDECISESAAIQKYGVNGYEMSSKTICGQSADAMVQYYCIHAVAGTAPAASSAPESHNAVSGTAAPTAPAAAPVTQKSPLDITTILAAIGTGFLVITVRQRE